MDANDPGELSKTVTISVNKETQILCKYRLLFRRHAVILSSGGRIVESVLTGA